MGLLASWVSVFANIAQVILLVLGMFLILVVLLQRGRGGGLAGAFGGAGGQSAFGTKAGDVFTKITIGIAILWVITNGVNGMLIRASQSALSSSQFASGEDEGGAQVSPGEGGNDVPLAPEAGSGATDGDEEGTDATDTGEGTASGEAASTSDEESTSNEGEAPADPDTGDEAAVEEGAADAESAETPETETTPDATTAPDTTEATPEAGASTDDPANPPN